jgi:spermidine synthase
VVLAGVIACFVLSGFAALLYQTAWLRQFSLVFGTSELAVATVLAAYMGGLAIGAAVAGRFVHRVRRPVLVYGFLEAGIAATALAVPSLLQGAGTLYGWLLGAQPVPPDAAAIGQPLFYLVVAFCVLALPTGLMGATLPLLTRQAVRVDREVGPRVALLYGTNTAGAVAGTVIAGFVLLPRFGLATTVWVGVAVNALVFAIAALIARRAQPLRVVEAWTGGGSGRPGPIRFLNACVAPMLTGGRGTRAAVSDVFTVQPAWMLPLMLVSGAAAFYYEVLWTRMLSHVLGGSIYAFATMLAAFLTGIALGSAAAGRFASGRERAAWLFGAVQIAIGLLSALIYAAIGPLLPAARGVEQLAPYAFAVMLPATLFIGATFPLAVRLLARDESEAAAVTGRVYAWNTVGAILGAVLAGFYLIPALGFEGSIRFVVSVNLLLALWTLLFVAPRVPALAIPAAATAVLVWFFYEPERPQAVISASALSVEASGTGQETYFAVGRTATVRLTRDGGQYYLRTNGLPEAAVRVRGVPALGQAEKWLSALPIAARPEARSMLAIGFGGGVTLEGVPSSIEAIDVIELEPEVIQANRTLSAHRAVDPLADPRVRLIINDARNALRLTSSRYDLITSQPSHPWTAGASHLFTREFAGLVRSRLNEDGVFVQWMGTGFVDEPLLRSLAATLADQFAYVRLYHAAGVMLYFMASDRPLDIERQLLRTGWPLNQHLLYYAYVGLNSINDFAAALLLDEQSLRQFAEGAPLSTDDRNRMATHSRALADGLTAQTLIDVVSPFDPLLDPTNWLHAEFGERLAFGYIARRMLVDGHPARAAALASAVGDDSTRALIIGLVRGHRGDPAGAAEAFQAALASNPRNSQARFALLWPELPSLIRGSASEEAMRIAAGLPPSAAAVLRGLGLAATGNYETLAGLDAQLADANVTDFWFPEALQLRADWRLRVIGEPQLALDALRMIDRALFLSSDPTLLMLRAEAAELLGDIDVLIESSRYAARQLSERLNDVELGRVAATGGELRQLAASSRVWLELLDSLTPEAAVSAADLRAEFSGVRLRAETLARLRSD